jgi:hypothetical protein
MERRRGLGRRGRRVGTEMKREVELIYVKVNKKHSY